MTIIAIVDYGAGNLRSVARAVAHQGLEATVTSDPRAVEDAAAVILPGVGAAGDAMRQLTTLGLVEPLRRVARAGRPFLAVCLGLQLLFSYSEEGQGCACLDILPGAVRRLPDGPKIPHMGWNQIALKVQHPFFEGIPDGSDFYFVHSYYVDPQDPEVVAATTEYSIPFCSAVARGTLVGTQFHPEKSSALGLRLYENFFRLAGLWK